ncbi:MAG: biotin--[Bacteroidales bacterium]|nr:biotin--[acetyl-CoA-carboxylase] ligase [Bacteroidales bacterium]
MKNGQIQFIANTSSTNKLLSDMMKSERASGSELAHLFALCTDYQSAGRGMGTNTWFSERGKNLLASIFFRTTLPAARQFLFNEYFALCTQESLTQYLPDVQIKWPNDIYVNGKKIAGILIEHTVVGDRLNGTIAGIGLNVNQEHFPDDIPHPTSLLLETGKALEVRSVMETLHQTLSDHWEKLSEANATKLHDQYMEHLYQKGIFSLYRIGGKEITAMIEDVDTFGRLQLRDRDGRLYTCGFKEVEFLGASFTINN